jgi:hypothetical protein
MPAACPLGLGFEGHNRHPEAPAAIDSVKYPPSSAPRGILRGLGRFEIGEQFVLAPTRSRYIKHMKQLEPTGSQIASLQTAGDRPAYGRPGNRKDSTAQRRVRALLSTFRCVRLGRRGLGVCVQRERAHFGRRVAEEGYESA